MVFHQSRWIGLTLLIGCLARPPASVGQPGALGAGPEAPTARPSPPQPAEVSQAERIEALEKRVRELEDLVRQLTGAAALPAPEDERSVPSTRPPAAPAPPVGGGRVRAEVVSVPDDAGATSRTGPISGYMDFHFNRPQHGDPVLDFHRFVLLFNHSFTDRLRFVGELELEHALVEGLEASGELELEQAYVDFLLTRRLNLRAGMLLAPVGIINERHEPPAFNGVERPFVDTFIVPTTWFDVGAGVHGDLGRGFSYRAYLMAPLDATGFSADEGIRGGRQKGFLSNVRNVAQTGRIEYRGLAGLTVGVSAWTGKTGFMTPRIHNRVTLAEIDGRYRRDRLQLRGQLARVFIDGAGPLNAAVERSTGVNPNIARQLLGVYGEVGYQLLPRRVPHEVVPFLRYERFDTQFRMPTGFVPLDRFDRSAWVLGLTYFPDPDVAVKLDYGWLDNRSATIEAPNTFNIGLGWWF